MRPERIRIEHMREPLGIDTEHPVVSWNIRTEDFTAYALYTDLEETAAFSCGHPLVDRLVRNAVWSLRGNLIDIPTDCPTREKSGFPHPQGGFIDKSGAFG